MMWGVMKERAITRAIVRENLWIGVWVRQGLIAWHTHQWVPRISSGGMLFTPTAFKAELISCPRERIAHSACQWMFDCKRGWNNVKEE